MKQGSERSVHSAFCDMGYHAFSEIVCIPVLRWMNARNF